MSKRWLGLLLLAVWFGGRGVAHAALTANPTSISFTNAMVGGSVNGSTQLSANPSVQVTLSLAATGCDEFTITSPTSINVGNGGGAKTLTVKLTPVTGGPKDCMILAKDSGGTLLLSIDASTTATAAQLTLDPATPLSFGNTEVGSTSTAQMLTATNMGDAPLVITSAALTASSVDFTVPTGSTTVTVQPGNSTSWTIACQPQSQGLHSGTFEILSNAAGATTTDVSLSCTGTQGIVTTIPTSHDFGGVVVGASVSFPFMIKNTGNVPITMLTGALSNTTKGYVFDPATVPGTLAAGATANLNVAFTPQSGSDGGPVGLVFNAVWGTNNTATTATLALNGDGQVASFTALPTPLAFGDFRFDTQPTLTFHIKNTGDVNISIDSVSFAPDPGTNLNGANEVQFAVTTPQTVTPTQQIDVVVTLKPNNRTGAVGGKITVHSNSTGTADQIVTVTGNATTAAFTATALVDFGAVDISTTPPSKKITITNTATSATLDVNSVTVMGTADPAFTLTGLPTSKITIAPGQHIDITVDYKPTTVLPNDMSESEVLLASFGGVFGNPPPAMLTIQGRGIDSSLVVQATPVFQPSFRNPGSKAQVQPIVIQNMGEVTLHITAASVSGAPVWQLIGPLSADVAPGQSQTFMVKFTPTDVGTAPTGTLTLVNQNHPNVSVSLNGTCMARMIAFGPSTLDTTGTPTITFPLTNADRPIDIADILTVSNMDPSVAFTIHRIDLASDSAAFTLDSAPADAALPADSTQSFGIKFAPPSTAEFHAQLQLFVDEDTQPQGTVNLVGNAVISEAHGSGGCSAGGGGGGGGGLVIGIAAIGLLLRRRHRGKRRGGGDGAEGARQGARLTTLSLAARLGLGGSVLVAALAVPAAADISIGVFQPTPATTGEGFALQSPDVGARGSWVMNAVASYASNALVIDSFNADGTAVVSNSPVKHSTLMQLGLAYALLDRLELGLHIPLYQQSGDDSPTGPGAKGTAHGDLTLHAKARVIRLGLGLGTLIAGASGAVVVPTASKDQYVSSGHAEVRLLALGSFTPAFLDEQLTLSVNLGPVIRGKSEFANVVEQSGLAWGAGASIRFLRSLWATGEVFGVMTPSGLQRQTAGAMSVSTLSQVEALVGFTVKPDRRIAVGVAVGRGVTDAIGTPDLRGVLSLSIVPGATPLAPLHSEKPDGDADGDGIPDSIDKCPNEPEDKDGFQDADGCPDPDNDGDGIPDAVDKCPFDPEDKDGFQDADGCPDPDNDGDGIPDKLDKCPNEPEDKDGFQDADGCPDPDNDHDGIPDEKDKCPNEPETINGFQDEDGCPDKGDSTIILSPDRIETLDPVQFTAANSLKLTKGSFNVLGQVGATLRAHPEIVRLRITVHVQPSGNADADQKRSEQRAQVIRDWLVQWGVAPARIEPRGLGGIKPLVPPDQRGAAKINDRLELIILERK